METEQLVDKAEGSLSNVTDKLGAWIEQGISLLPNLAVAVLVLLGFALLGRIAARLTRSGLERASKNEQVTGLATQVMRIAVLAAGLFVALGVLGLDKTVSSLLAGVGILGLAIGFAFQDLLSNLMSGILLAFRRPFERGELIETNDIMGHVDDTKLSATLVRTFDGQLVWIPNKQVLESVLTNFSRLGKRRVEVAVGVSYGDDLELAERTCRDALSALDFRDPSQDVDVWFTGFGGSSVDMSVRLWIDLRDGQAGYLKARSEMVKALKSALDAAGLTIPFPIRTLDFGITGGEELRQHLGVLRSTDQRDGDSSNGSARAS